jgi:hypothetical protein
MEQKQIKLTTIPAISKRLSEEETEDYYFAPPFPQPTTFPPSTSTLTVSEHSDKEWLIKDDTGDSSRGSHHIGEHARDNLRGQTSGRRKSLTFDKVEYIIKMCAMACACTFGVGSHFASHIIGPMKGILMEVLYLRDNCFAQFLC